MLHLNTIVKLLRVRLVHVQLYVSLIELSICPSVPQDVYPPLGGGGIKLYPCLFIHQYIHPEMVSVQFLENRSS